MAAGILLSFTVSIWGYFTATSTTIATYGRHVVQHQVANMALEKGVHDYMILSHAIIKKNSWSYYRIEVTLAGY